MDEISKLKEELILKEKEIKKLRCALLNTNPTVVTEVKDVPSTAKDLPLSNQEILRYSRQLILPEVGKDGQEKFKASSVLIVGCGGLGCPAAIYLAAAGIGRLGLVDYDEVELSNLHRQILHTETRQFAAKSASAAQACNQLNSLVECVPYHMSLTRQNALQLIKLYDIIVDATDNVASRYLLNDACVLAGKPLVSGSALRFEGQLTVYNHNGGPCYRCLYPKPPPPETVTNCSDGGVLGVVPGIIGSLQALEVMKIAVGMGTTLSGRLLLFDALDCGFRNVKLRARQSTCDVCGDQPSITKLIDYEQFCGARATDKSNDLTVLSPEDRISVHEYKSVIDNGQAHVLLDVRQPVELSICCLPQTLNIPIDKIARPEAFDLLKEHVVEKDINKPVPVFVVCRRGNDSQLAVKAIQDKLKEIGSTARDITGGLTAWAKHIDTDMPIY